MGFIYLKYHHNKGIKNELEAWLTFLGSDKPEDIVERLKKRIAELEQK